MLGPNCGYEEVGWREEAAKSGTHSTIRWAQRHTGEKTHNNTMERRHTTTHWREGTQRQWVQVAQRDTQWSKLEHENTHNNKCAQNDTQMDTQCR